MKKMQDDLKKTAGEDPSLVMTTFNVDRGKQSITADYYQKADVSAFRQAMESAGFSPKEIRNRSSSMTGIRNMIPQTLLSRVPGLARLRFWLIGVMLIGIPTAAWAHERFIAHTPKMKFLRAVLRLPRR